MSFLRERSGSVVECLTRDRRAGGSSLTGVTALWSLSKTHLSWLSTGSTQEDPSRIAERLLSGRKESNQTNINMPFLVTVTLTSGLVLRIIVSGAYLLYCLS